MKKTVILGLLLSVFVSSFHFVHAEIRADHPRMYVTADTVGEIQRRCREEYKPVYEKFKSARWILDQSPGVSNSHMTNMMLPAFLYLVEGDELYANKTKGYLDALSQAPPENQYMTPEYIRAAAVCYDWVYDQLSQPEKERYAKALVEMGDYVLTLWRHSDFNNHFVNETLAVIYVGVVLAGDGIDDAAAERFLKIGEDYLKNHAVPAANEIAGDDGGQAEGFSYNDWGYARPLTHTVEMWRVATGENLFEGSTFFQTQSFWHLYCQRPHDGNYVKAEDCPSGFKPGESLKSFIHLIGARCNDGYAQWIGDQIEWQYNQKAWEELLWRDPDLEALSPRDLPLARHFKKLGWVVSRSGWTSRDDTFSLFQCGDFFAGHQHLDANTFVIHKGGSLAIDSGVNEYSSHRANYYARTIAHNGILVFDPNESFSSAVWSAQGDGGSNDGGQMRGFITDRTGKFVPGCPSDVGTITQFFSTPNFTYACGDATRAYHPGKMEQFTRQFVHIQPDIFVVFDRVVSKEPSFKKTWLIHSMEQPGVDGNRFDIQQSRGKLTGWTLLPEPFQNGLVGGRGKESWVNGRNYPPDSKSDPESGAWRIEISPSESQKSDVFLHVLQAGLQDSFQEAKVSALSEDNLTGAMIQYAESTARVLFSAKGDPQCSIRIERAGKQVEKTIIGQVNAGVSDSGVHR